MTLLLVGMLAVSPGVGEPKEIMQGYQEQAIINLHNDMTNIESIANYLAAEAERIRVEQEIEAQRNRIPTDFARWMRLHNCEQGNTWYANGGNPADPAKQIFQGGLGMSTAAWRMAVSAAANRGVILPASALSATPEQQMVGAQAFYDAHGWGWECRV
jgi:hypothetical protein